MSDNETEDDSSQQQEEEEYKSTFLAQIIHSVPRYNLNLEHAKNIIELDNYDYLESLGIFGSFFLLWLLLTLLILFVTLMKTVFSMNSRSIMTLRTLKVILAFLISVSLISVAVGTVGEATVHWAMLSSLEQTEEVLRIFDKIAVQSYFIYKTLSQDYVETYKKWKSGIHKCADAQEMFKIAEWHRFVILDCCRSISRPLREFPSTVLIKKLSMFETARSSASMAGWCAGVSLCLFTLYATTWKSVHRGLTVVSIGALCGLVGFWIGAAARAPALLVLSDACVDPIPFVSYHSRSKLPADMFQYLFSCKERDTHTLGVYLQNIKTNITRMQHLVADLVGLNPEGLLDEKKLYRAQVLKAQLRWHKLDQTYNCQKPMAHFKTGVHTFCNVALPAVLLQVTCCIVSSLSFTVIVLIQIISKRLPMSTVGDSMDPSKSQSLSGSNLNSRNQFRRLFNFRKGVISAVDFENKIKVSREKHRALDIFLGLTSKAFDKTKKSFLEQKRKLEKKNARRKKRNIVRAAKKLLEMENDSKESSAERFYKTQEEASIITQILQIEPKIRFKEQAHDNIYRQKFCSRYSHSRYAMSKVYPEARTRKHPRTKPLHSKTYSTSSHKKPVYYTRSSTWYARSRRSLTVRNPTHSAPYYDKYWTSSEERCHAPSKRMYLNTLNQVRYRSSLDGQCEIRHYTSSYERHRFSSVENLRLSKERFSHKQSNWANCNKRHRIRMNEKRRLRREERYRAQRRAIDRSELYLDIMSQPDLDDNPESKPQVCHNLRPPSTRLLTERKKFSPERDTSAILSNESSESHAETRHIGKSHSKPQPSTSRNPTKNVFFHRKSRPSYRSSSPARFQTSLATRDQASRQSATRTLPPSIKSCDISSHLSLPDVRSSETCVVVSPNANLSSNKLSRRKQSSSRKYVLHESNSSENAKPKSSIHTESSNRITSYVSEVESSDDKTSYLTDNRSTDKTLSVPDFRSSDDITLSAPDIRTSDEIIYSTAEFRSSDNKYCVTNPHGAGPLLNSDLKSSSARSISLPDISLSHIKLFTTRLIEPQPLPGTRLSALEDFLPREGNNLASKSSGVISQTTSNISKLPSVIRLKTTTNNKADKYSVPINRSLQKVRHSTPRDEQKEISPLSSLNRSKSRHKSQSKARHKSHSKVRKRSQSKIKLKSESKISKSHSKTRQRSQTKIRRKLECKTSYLTHNKPRPRSALKTKTRQFETRRSRGYTSSDDTSSHSYPANRQRQTNVKPKIMKASNVPLGRPLSPIIRTNVCRNSPSSTQNSGARPRSRSKVRFSDDKKNF